jgi:hypothetical protein
LIKIFVAFLFEMFLFSFERGQVLLFYKIYFLIYFIKLIIHRNQS